VVRVRVRVRRAIVASHELTINRIMRDHRPRVSLLQFERDRNKLELWPLFSYATDPASQAKRLRLLVTVVQYQATATSYDLKVPPLGRHHRLESAADVQRPPPKGTVAYDEGGEGERRLVLGVRQPADLPRALPDVRLVDRLPRRPHRPRGHPRRPEPDELLLALLTIDAL